MEMVSENRTSQFRAGLTLVALVAMSATVATGPALRAEETRLESHVVRAVAAAVVAAARDLLVSDHPVAAAAVLEHCLPADGPCVGGDASSREAVPVHACLLSERLLDLPPPTC